MDIIENNPKARTRRKERKNKNKRRGSRFPQDRYSPEVTKTVTSRRQRLRFIHPENEKNISRANLPSQNIVIHAPICRIGARDWPRQDGESVPKIPTYTISEHDQLVFS
jgi:hypothetical protein